MTRPAQQIPTAISIFGPDWRQARKTELDKHLRQHYSRRDLAVLNRALNALTRYHGSFQATRHITLGKLADLAARAATDQVNNQLWKIHAAAIGEAMVTAKKAGLEPEVWWAAMKGGAADSFVLQHDVPAIFAGHYDPSFRLALCLKDLALIDDLVRQTGTRSELTQATYARFREAAERYGEDAGEMSVCRLIEEDAGVDLRVAGDWIAPWEVKHPDEAASESSDDKK